MVVSVLTSNQANGASRTRMRRQILRESLPHYPRHIVSHFLHWWSLSDTKLCSYEGCEPLDARVGRTTDLIDIKSVTLWAPSTHIFFYGTSKTGDEMGIGRSKSGPWPFNSSTYVVRSPRFFHTTAGVSARGNLLTRVPSTCSGLFRVRIYLPSFESKPSFFPRQVFHANHDSF